MDEILSKFKQGKLTRDQAKKTLQLDYLERINKLACLDIFRHARTGFPEVVLAESKPKGALEKIINAILKNHEKVIISKIKEEQFKELRDYGKKNKDISLDINKTGRIAVIARSSQKIADSDTKKQANEKFIGKIGIITAGTSDIPIAEEIRVICKAMGCILINADDVGIAGLHRIFEPLKKMVDENVSVIIVLAGMEGTLPGVVASLVDIPVIGVPISSGYGYRGKGETALMTMLQSCSPGLTVVNIDNGFGAAVFAIRILNSIRKQL
ncbi:MAG: nickel pincer cofactor biosynthesis protein LarB [Candidatus Lokiarchaeota archaeon]|nr:nickel pincer cofactor biosynthesis protein LarB [Candidatus Lokiarchaeota archaeon]